MVVLVLIVGYVELEGFLRYAVGLDDLGSNSERCPHPKVDVTRSGGTTEAE